MLEVQDLSVNYRNTQVLEHISVCLHPGQVIGLIGPNGAGKTTLLKALLGLLPASSGHVLLNGLPLRRQRQRIAYVPQRSQIDWNYPITAWNVVMMAHTPSVGWFRRPGQQARRIAHQMLEKVGMDHLRSRQIGQLSGGQQQRVFLARALAQDADVLLLDEPFTGVDKTTEAIMLRVFDDLKAQGKTLLICNHEWGEALYRYDRLLLLNRKLLADDQPQNVMTLEKMQLAYGESVYFTQNGQSSRFFFC
jgi:manganese/iron transport system ATP-binding protein